jgi:hypothetical protein
MKYPWTKKNPFLSMWLSGANAVFGAARGKAVAESRRQTALATTQAKKQLTAFWTGGLPAAQPKKRKKRR